MELTYVRASFYACFVEIELVKFGAASPWRSFLVFQKPNHRQKGLGLWRELQTPRLGEPG